MAKEENSNIKELKKQNIYIYIILCIVSISCILSLVSLISIKKETNEYDTSMMRIVGVQDVLEMFESNETYILYIGRETCSLCVDLLPTLQQAQINNNYITQYMDITEVDRNSEGWEKISNLLDMETSTTLNEDGTSELVTETYGYFITNKGYTPCVILIQNGQQTSGFFGNKSLTNFQDWLDSNGI